MTVNISGQVPGEQQNGLVDIEGELTQERTPEPILAVVIIERSTLKFNDLKQDWSATIRFRHIEPIEDETDATAARTLLEKAYATRTGETTLPIELDEPGEVTEPELDLDKPLVDEDSSNVTDGPWEPDVDDEGPVPA